MTDAAASSGRPEPPLIPPPEFVARLNENRGPGLPHLTALDPLAMLMWHTITRPPEPGDLLRVTGC